MPERNAARLLLCASLLCRSAFAAETEPLAASEPPGARAAALFDQGVAALKAGHFETACPALEQSQSLEASLGALLALADCLERWQKPAAASARYAQFVEAVAQASPEEARYRADQVAFARTALGRLEPQIAWLELTSPVPLPGDARVVLDGVDVPADAREGGLRLEPGHHVLETLAPGHEPRRVELDLSLGQRRSASLELGPPLRAAPEPLPSAASADLTTGTPAAPSSMAHDEQEAAGSTGSAWRTVGWGLGGLGLVGVGAGAVAGAMLLETCPGLDCAAHEERGKRLALITDVGLGVGLVALISSVIVLVNTQPPASSRDGAASFNPALAMHTRGAWFGMSHSF